MSQAYESTRLWRLSLAAQDTEDVNAPQRERLRSSYKRLRARAALLAAEIHRSLPEYTVHDITHLDALWELAELVAGPDLQFTPTEAYVFGGSCLLHDLGMALASYSGGLDALRKEPTWDDAVAREFSTQLGRPPTRDEQKAPPREIQDRVVATLLRLLHAKHAETLAIRPWRLGPQEPEQYLIEDTDIRQAYGRTIGRIAHSHWWPVDRLDEEFSRTLGAPHWCPKDWVVDPLKLACLLRLADAAHIDASRAPAFLRCIRKPATLSDSHWSFQEKLQKPHIADDALVFTSGYAFPFNEASSWWLCLDTLKTIDAELRSVDSLLADKKVRRFAARRVAGVDSPERLVAYVPTEGWLPVNAALQVSDLPRLIETLGGTELYGRDLRIPIRELLQNAADAIRARRVVDARPKDWGEIRVALGRDDDQDWIEVADNGIGMSRDVLTHYLLDFGTTYWGSTLMLAEFPGLLTSGFEATGKYGIGFFAAFMLGDGVRVTTRRYEAAHQDTQVLEFNTGLSGRPILRPAQPDEILREGGTSIRVWLRRRAHADGGLLSQHADNKSLAALCRQVAPALDVNIATNEFGDASPVVVAASDWASIDGMELLRRVHDWGGHSDVPFESVQGTDEVVRIAANIRDLREANALYGRACLVPDRYGLIDLNLGGVITIGGLTAAPVRGIAGILTGVSRRAARDLGRPIVPATVLRAWASEQARLAAAAFDVQQLSSVAGGVWACGGDLGSLPFAFVPGGGYLTSSDVAARFGHFDEVLIGSSYQAERLTEHVDNLAFGPNVVFVDDGLFAPVVGSATKDFWPLDTSQWQDFEDDFVISSLTGAVIFALADAWSIPATTLANMTNRHYLRGRRVVASSAGREFTESVTMVRRLPMADPDPAEEAKEPSRESLGEEI